MPQTLADVQEARSKTTMTVSPHYKTNMLANIFLDFDRLMEPDATTALRSTRAQDSDENSSDDNDADDAERIKFGFDKHEWKRFLRRLGLDGPSTQGSAS